MTDQEKRDFYKQRIAEMLDNVKSVDILNAVRIFVEDVIQEDDDEDIEN